MTTYLSPEVLILGAVVTQRDIRSAQKVGLLTSHFGGMRERNAWKVLVEFAEQNGGNVPTFEMFSRLSGYEDYVAPPENISVEALAKDIIKLARVRAVQQILPDPNELAQDPEKALMKIVTRGRELLAEGGDESVVPFTAAAKQYEETIDDPQELGLLYPWESLNGPSMGALAGEWIVIYGRPGSMKTWALISILAEWVKKYSGKRFLFISCELPRRIIERRLLALLIGKPYNDVRRKQLTLEDRLKLNIVRSLLEGEDRQMGQVFISKPKGDNLTLGNITKLVETVNPDGILIDSCGKMKIDAGDFDSRDMKQLAKLSSGIQKIAEDKGIPIIGSFHANRTKAESVAGASGGGDVGYSDALSQDADILARCYVLPMDDGTKKLLFHFTKTREFPFEGLLIEPPPLGTYKEVLTFSTTSAVENEIQKAQNRGRQTKASGVGLDAYADRGKKKEKRDGS